MKLNLKLFFSYLHFLTASSIFGIQILFLNPVIAQNHIDSLLQQIEKRDGEVRIGLVLAGGGAKGLAHIGVLKVLEEEGIKVEYVGGTSMGGLVGGLYAIGFDACKLEQIALQMDWDKLINDKVSRRDLVMDEKSDLSSYLLSLPLIGFVPNLPNSLKKGQLIKNEISKLTWNTSGVNDFSKLPIPFFCVASDIETGEEVVLEKGDLALALRSTMSIPTIFEPIILNNQMLVDGGIVNNFPVDIMKAKGINFVIGIDLSTDINSKKQIKTIIEVLDQSASIYGKLNGIKSIENTDLYIKPDLTGIGSLDFSTPEVTIQRGVDAARAKIDEIKAIARYLQSKNIDLIEILNPQDTILISGVRFNVVEPSSIRIIKSRLGLKLPGSYSIKHINEAINRIYYSGYFEDVNYKIVKVEHGYFLQIQVKEKTNNLFRVGGHFNEYTKAALLLNVSLRNFLIKGSKTNLSFILGENPGINFRYLQDGGSLFGYGIIAGYSTRELLTYNDNFTNVLSSYFNTFTNVDLVLFTNYSSNRRLMLGSQFEYFSLESKVSYIPSVTINQPFYNLYAKYDIDYWDDANYPSCGLKANMTLSHSLKNKGKPLTLVSANIEGAFTLIKKKLFIQPGIFAIASIGNKSGFPYYFVIGGQNVNFNYRMIDFVGMSYTSYYVNNALIARLKLRWNFSGRHNVFAIGNIGSFDENIELIFSNSKNYYGGGIGYSLNSLIGPIELSISASNQGPTNHGVLNIGYWF